MAEYTYLSRDILTGRVIGEIPGVMRWKIIHEFCDFGKFRARIFVNALWAKSTWQMIEDATTPHRVEVWVLRDNVPVAVCDVWTRTGRNVDSMSFEIGGALTGSYLDWRPLGGRNYQQKTYKQVDQAVIISNLVSDCQTEWGSLGITVPSVPATGRKRDITYDPGDNVPYGQRLKEMADNIDGFEFRFDGVVNDAGNFEKIFRFGYPRLGRPNALDLYAAWDDETNQYSGNIRKFPVDEDGTRQATDVVWWGVGEGAKQKKAVRENADLAAIMPRTGLGDISDDKEQATLESKADALKLRSRIAFTAPDIEVVAEDVLGVISVGDDINVSIDEGPVLPRGFVGTYRLLGMEIETTNELDSVALTVGTVY